MTPTRGECHNDQHPHYSGSATEVGTLVQQPNPRVRPLSASSAPRPCISVAANRPFSAPRIRRLQTDPEAGFAATGGSHATAPSASSGPSRPASARYTHTSKPASARCWTPDSTAPSRPGSAARCWTEDCTVASAPLRPRSAPGTGRPSTVGRPCSAAGTGRPAATVQTSGPAALPPRPASAGPGTVQRSARPRSAPHSGRPLSAFDSLRRRRQLGAHPAASERPPRMQSCEPQTRFMNKEAQSYNSFAHSFAAPERSPAPSRPISAPPGARTAGTVTTEMSGQER